MFIPCLCECLFVVENYPGGYEKYMSSDTEAREADCQSGGKW